MSSPFYLIDLNLYFRCLFIIELFIVYSIVYYEPMFYGVYFLNHGYLQEVMQ